MGRPVSWPPTHIRRPHLVNESTPADPTPPATTPASPDATAAPADTRPEYEFDENQNKVIDELAMAIVWVRLPLLIVGLLEALLATGLAFRLPKDGAHIFGVMGHALAAVV